MVKMKWSQHDFTCFEVVLSPINNSLFELGSNSEISRPHCLQFIFNISFIFQVQSTPDNNHYSLTQ